MLDQTMLQFEQAQKHLQENRIDEAEHAYRSALALASAEQTPLPLSLLVDLMLGIGFCHARREQWQDALTTYYQLEPTINQDKDWFTALPHEVLVAVPMNYDPRLLQAVLYDSIALAYDNSGNIEQADVYFHRAIDNYLAIHRVDRAVETWYCVGNSARRRQDWKQLQQAGAAIVSLLNHNSVPNTSSVKVNALQFLVQAASNQGNMEDCESYLQAVVELERSIQHPDLAQDERLLQNVRIVIQQKKHQSPTSKKWWHFWKT